MTSQATSCNYKTRVSNNFLWFYDVFCRFLIIVKMIIDFKKLFTCFSLKLTTIWSRAQVNHKGVEKYIFHCFDEECCPKWDFEKLTTVSITQWQTLYLVQIVPLTVRYSPSSEVQNSLGLLKLWPKGQIRPTDHTYLALCKPPIHTEIHRTMVIIWP